MRNSIWVVTSEVNDYNQYGRYFLAAYNSKPTFDELKKLLPNSSDTVVGKLTRGGGRESVEDVWYMLTEMSHGELSTNSEELI